MKTEGEVNQLLRNNDLLHLPKQLQQCSKNNTEEHQAVPRGNKGSGLQLRGLTEQGDDALPQSAPPAHCSPSLQLQLLWKHAASILWGFILIIATVMEIVLTNMYFNNILHSLSTLALKISEVLNRRQWKSSPVFPQGKLKQAGKDLWCGLIVL